MSGASEPPDWSKRDVLRRLHRDTPEGRQASAHFFLDVPEDQVKAAAERLFDAAAAQFADAVVAPTLGKVHALAKSFSATGDPAFLTELGRSDEVRDVLPSEIDDIFPRPKTP